MNLTIRYKEEGRDAITRACILDCFPLSTTTNTADGQRHDDRDNRKDDGEKVGGGGESIFVAAAHVVEAIAKDDLFRKMFPYRKVLHIRYIDGDTITRDLMRVDAKPVSLGEPIDVTLVRDSPSSAAIIRDSATTIALGAENAFPPSLSACVNTGLHHKVRVFNSTAQGFVAIRKNENAIAFGENAKLPFAFLVEIAPVGISAGTSTSSTAVEFSASSGEHAASSSCSSHQATGSRDFINRGHVAVTRENSSSFSGTTVTQQPSAANVHADDGHRMVLSGSPTTLCESTAAELFVFSELADVRKILHDVHFHSQSLIDYEIGRRNDWQYIKVPDSHELMLNNKRVKDLVRLGIPQSIRAEFYSKIGAADLLRISHRHRLKKHVDAVVQDHHGRSSGGGGGVDEQERVLQGIISAADDHFETVLAQTFRLIDADHDSSSGKTKTAVAGASSSTANEQDGNSDTMKMMTRVPADYVPRFAPTFEGDVTHISKFLTQGGQRALKLILSAVAERHPDVIESPMLAPLTGLFCLHLRPSQAFLTTMTLVSTSRHNKQLQGRIYWLKLSRTEYYRFVALTAMVIRKKVPQRCFNAFDTINDVAFVVDEMLREFFCKTFPLAFISRILDCYVCEGHKVLIRFAIAAFKFCEAELTAVHGTQAAREILLGFPGKKESLYVRMNSVLFNQIAAYGFSLNIKREDLLVFEKACEDAGEALAAHRNSAVPPQRCIRRMGKITPSSDIVRSLSDAEPLWLWLPHTATCLERIFTSNKGNVIIDSTPLRNLYNTTGSFLSRSRSSFTGFAPKDCLILIQCSKVRNDSINVSSSEDAVEEEEEEGNTRTNGAEDPDDEKVTVGVYLQDAMPDGTKQRYIGSPQSFVFSLNPIEVRFATAAPIVNKYFLLCESEHLTIGGGSHGGACIRISSSLEEGTSTSCETYSIRYPLVKTRDLNRRYEKMEAAGKLSPTQPLKEESMRPRPPSTSFLIDTLEVFSVS